MNALARVLLMVTIGIAVGRLTSLLLERFVREEYHVYGLGVALLVSAAVCQLVIWLLG